jgi:sirohydrochlorin cobaltochelatase
MTRIGLPISGSRPVGPRRLPLLIVGHGTRSAAGLAEFTALVDRVGARLAAAEVEVAGGLIELAPPPVHEAIAGLTAAGHTRFVAVPLMLVAAGHAKGDIPAALARESARQPGLSYRYGRPLGPHPGVLAALQARLDAVLAVEARPDTHVVLVGRGSTDPEANAEVFKAGRLFEEGRRFAGVEPAFVSLTRPGVPAALERCRRLGAREIVVLPYFLFSGVLPDRIAGQAREWAAQASRGAGPARRGDRRL